MLPDYSRRCYPCDATREEMRELFLQRLQALEDATCCATWGDPLPVAWRWGWSAKIDVQGRSRDGSLCVRIRCNGPGLRREYVRNVRLVKRARLNQNFS